jgi:hypothetical protein
MPSPSGWIDLATVSHDRDEPLMKLSAGVERALMSGAESVGVNTQVLPSEPAADDESPAVVRFHPSVPGDPAEHAELVPGASLAEAVAVLALRAA